MKKYIKGLSAILLGSVFILGACAGNGTPSISNPGGNEQGGEHQHTTHTYTSQLVSPTCTEQGYTLHTCTCGDSYKDNYVDVLGHSFITYTSNNDATCLEDGTQSAKCERCGAIDTKADAGTALGHSYSDDWTSDETGHWHSADCEHTTLTKDLAGHTLSDWVMTKEPTRTEEGLKIKSCAICGYEETQKIAKINYDYTEGLGYKLNDTKTGYIVTYSYDTDDRSMKVSTENASTIAPHCLYKGLPVVGFDGLASWSSSDEGIQSYVKKIILPETISQITLSAAYFSSYTLTSLVEIVVSENNPYLTSLNGVLYNKDMSELIFFPVAKGTSFSVPESVKKIGDYAFFSCKLTSLTLPNGLEYIGRSGLNAASLTNIQFPDSLMYVGQYGVMAKRTIYNDAIYAGDSKNPYLVLLTMRYVNSTVSKIHPDTKIIAEDAFAYGFPDLMSNPFEIPESVVSICDGAFQAVSGSSGMKDIVLNIGSNVKYIGDMVFSSVSSSFGFAAINVSDKNQYYSSDGGVLYNKDKTELIAYPTRKIGDEFIVPNTCHKIASGAFYFNENLTKIELPSNIDYIDDYVFYYCSNLSGIQIPEKVMYIGKSAFDYCTEVTDIEIPDSVTYIGAYAFRGCKKLTTLTLGKSVGFIGSAAFWDTNLEKVYYNGDLASWYSIEFNGSYASPTYISGTHSGATLYINGTIISGVLTIPDSIAKIGSYSGFVSDSITGIVIPDSVTTIGEEVFYYFIPGPDWIILGANVKRIGSTNGRRIGKVFFKGTEEDRENIEIGSVNNGAFNNAAKWYYYSATKPTGSGNYWHYDTDGVTPIIWSE